jgi:hypothetical protein
MGRPRTPTNILKLKGADKVNPARFKDRENEPQNVNPVGEPFPELSEREKAAWRQFVSESIDGVLGEADRVALSLAVKLYIKCQDDEATGQEQRQLFNYLGQFGMLPGDRSKISIPQKKETNPFADD